MLLNRFIWLLVQNGWVVRPLVHRLGPVLLTLLAAVLLTASVSGVIVSLAVLEAVIVLFELIDLAKDWLMIRIQLAGRRNR